MRLLLDTHVLLWLMREPHLIPASVLIKIESSEVYVSIATLWEIAIKNSIGKLDLPADFDAIFPSKILESGLILFPIDMKHVSAVRKLEYHHRDPFDRLLIAQAQVEQFTIVTRDPHFVPYNVPILWSTVQN